MPKYINVDALVAELNCMDGLIYHDLVNILTAVPADDAVETLQAGFIELHEYRKVNEQTTVSRLVEERDEAQRRERAAVEDLRKIEDCRTCAKTDCGRDVHCPIGTAYEWRGPVAGEGERDGG